MEKPITKEFCKLFDTGHKYEWVTAEHGYQVWKCKCGDAKDEAEDSQP